MSAETTFHNDRGDIVFEASGENRYQMFKKVKNEHLDEIHEIFGEHRIEESGEAEKDVRAWWAAAHPDGWIDTVEETAPPPSTLYVFMQTNGLGRTFKRLSHSNKTNSVNEFMQMEFVWNGSEWEMK